MELNEMEKKLNAHYGAKKLKTVLATVKKENKYLTKRGVLNKAANIEKTGATLDGAWLGYELRKNKKTDVVTGVTFRVMKGADRIRVMLHDIKFADKLPEAPPMLTGVQWMKLTSVLNVIHETTYYRTNDKSTFEVLKDSAIEIEVVPITLAINREKARGADDRWLFQTIAGEVQNVNAGEGEYGEFVRLTIEDEAGERISCKIEENLKDLFGEADWLDDWDTVRMNLLHMSVIANGRINISEEFDRTSFVVKRGGWVADSDALGNVKLKKSTAVSRAAGKHKKQGRLKGFAKNVHEFIRTENKGEGVTMDEVSHHFQGEKYGTALEDCIEAGFVYEPTVGFFKAVAE